MKESEAARGVLRHRKDLRRKKGIKNQNLNENGISRASTKR